MLTFKYIKYKFFKFSQKWWILNTKQIDVWVSRGILNTFEKPFVFGSYKVQKIIKNASI